MSHDGEQKRRGGKSRKSTKRRRGALHRDALPSVPLPRHRQPSANDRKRASRLIAAAEFADALEHHRAELRKSRLNLDEIVHLLKGGTDPASISNIIETAVEECRVICAKGRETFDDFKELFAKDAEASGPER